MRPMFRLFAAGGLLVVFGCALSAPASAAGGPGYQVQAQGEGLQITLAGTTLVGGTSSASAGSSAATEATGDGTLTPAVTESAHASVSDPGASQSVPEGCAQPTTPFPAPLASLVSLGIACASAAAAQDANGMPNATGTGEVASLEITPSQSALSTLVTQGSPLAAALAQLFGALPSLPAAGSPLSSVLASVAQASSAQLSYLVKVTVGSSSSSVSATSTSATASTQDAAVTVSLLGGVGSGGGPLATVVIGSAATNTSLDRSSGTVTTSDTPAVVTVDVTPPVGTPIDLSIAPGISQTILSGTPLATTIAAGSGSATPGSGQGSASAEGVEVDALTGVGATDAAGTNGGVGVKVAGSSSTVAAQAVAVTPTTAATAATPHTAAAPVVHTASAAVPGVTTVHTGEYWAGRLPIVLAVLTVLTSLLLLRRPNPAHGRAIRKLLHLGQARNHGEGSTS